MTSKAAQPEPALSAQALKCLATLIDAEIEEKPIEIYVWRAQNAKKIPHLDELRRNHLLSGHSHYEVSFLGLMSARSRRARVVIDACEKVFKVLRKHLPKHPKETISLAALADQARLSPSVAKVACTFLSRSPASLGFSDENQERKYIPNENYLTLKNFDALKSRAREQIRYAGQMPNSFGATESANWQGLTGGLFQAESEPVRESWQRAMDRVHRDPEGAITAARSLLESACRHVLDEYGVVAEAGISLSKLHRLAVKELQLDPHRGVNAALRQMLQGAASVVEGLAALRNDLGDAHGKDRSSPRAARRHSELAVLLAAGIGGFLLSALDAKRTP
jgi:hypothetical protein